MHKCVLVVYSFVFLLLFLHLTDFSRIRHWFFAVYNSSYLLEEFEGKKGHAVGKIEGSLT